MRSTLLRKLSRFKVGRESLLHLLPPSPSLFFISVRSAHETVHHTWPPSNQLTTTILQLARENLGLTRNDSPNTEAGVRDDAIATSTSHVPTSGLSSANSIPPQSAIRHPFPVVVDLTFGDGFHSRAILEEFRDEDDLILFAVDRDPKAVQLAQALKQEETRRVIPIHARFSDCLSHFQSFVSHPGFADVVLIDAGLSKLQENDSSRGFVIHPNASSPLDMRMDPTSTAKFGKPSASSSSSPTLPSPTAADVLESLTQAELAQIFKKYGEEKNNKSLANLVFDTKYAFGPIRTTEDLAKVISSHAYKEYQSEWEYASIQRRQTMNALRALRYFVNDELNELYAGIEAAFVLLKPEGLLLVSAQEIALNRVIKEALDAYQDPNRLPEREESGTQSLKSYGVSQGEADPSVVFSREDVESLLTRKWKKLRKELVVDDGKISLEQQDSEPRLQHTRLRAVTKNPHFEKFKRRVEL